MNRQTSPGYAVFDADDTPETVEAKMATAMSLFQAMAVAWAHNFDEPLHDEEPRDACELCSANVSANTTQPTQHH